MSSRTSASGGLGEQVTDQVVEGLLCARDVVSAVQEGGARSLPWWSWWAQMNATGLDLALQLEAAVRFEPAAHNDTA